MTLHCEKCGKTSKLKDGEEFKCLYCGNIVTSTTFDDEAMDKGNYVSIDELLAEKKKVEEYRAIIEEMKRNGAAVPENGTLDGKKDEAASTTPVTSEPQKTDTASVCFIPPIPICWRLSFRLRKSCVLP